MTEPSSCKHEDVEWSEAWNGAKDTVMGMGVYCKQCGELLEIQ